MHIVKSKVNRFIYRTHQTNTITNRAEIMTDLDEEMEIDETAMKEVILNELNSGKLSFGTSPTHIYYKCCSDPNSVYQQMKQSMEQQHFHEKQGEYLYRWSLIVSCVYVCVSACARVCMCVCLCLCVFVSVCACVCCLYLCVRACVCMRVCVHMCI